MEKITWLPLTSGNSDTFYGIKNAYDNEGLYMFDGRGSDVEFIIMACNNHYELLGACKEALKEFNSMGYKPKKAVSLLRDIIAKAEGK